MLFLWRFFSHLWLAGSLLAPVQRLTFDGTDQVCTAFAIEATTWVTAHHCLTTGTTMRIHDQAVDILGEFPDADILVLEGPNTQFYPLAAVDVQISGAVTVIGYPYGVGPVTTHGMKAAKPLETPLGLRTLYAVSVSPGSSGSPILNARGEVVGIVEGVTPNNALTVGIPYDVTVMTLQPFQ